MVILKGQVVQGIKDSQKRFTRPDFRAAYHKATREEPPKGTLNVKVKRCIPIKEHFRIRGSEVSERENFLFEICRIDEIWAYRIRPYDPCTGTGGHGDDTLEICCSKEIPHAADGSTEVQIELFRDDI